MAPEVSLLVEVVYAGRDRQIAVRVELPEPATIADAIAAAGRLPEFSGLDLSARRTGIFGRLAQPGTRLRRGDRVEIYRPLLADPKQARARRAQKRKSRQAAD